MTVQTFWREKDTTMDQLDEVRQQLTEHSHRIYRQIESIPEEALGALLQRLFTQHRPMATRASSSDDSERAARLPWRGTIAFQCTAECVGHQTGDYCKTWSALVGYLNSRRRRGL